MAKIKPNPAEALLQPTVPFQPQAMVPPQVPQVAAPEMSAPDINATLFQPQQPVMPKLADAPIPGRPTGVMDNMSGWRKAGLLLSAFAGEAAKPGSMQPLFGQMRNDQSAQRQYDVNKPVLQQQANDERDTRGLTQYSTRSGIDLRNREFTQEQNNKKATLLSQLQGELQAGKVPPDQLKYKYGRLASVQGISLTPDEINNELQQVKPVGAAFTVVKGEKGRPEGLQDRAGNVYTPDKIPNDPAAQSMWNAAQASHQQGLTEEEQKEGRLFDRQNALIDKRFANQETLADKKAATGKATADEQRRADLSGNLDENLDKLEEIVKRRGDLFGPVAGRWTGIKAAAGTSDPDIGTLETIKHQLGMAQISAHGMRSAQGIDAAAQSILNGFKNEPSAVLASIKAARDSVQTFKNDVINAKKGGGGGVVNVVGPSSGGDVVVYATNPQTKQRVMSKDGGKSWQPAQ